MELNSTHIKLILRKISKVTDYQDELKFENQIAKNLRFLEEYRLLQKIWEESKNSGIYKQIDTESDWAQVQTKLEIKIPMRYHRIGWTGYFLRIAAVLVLALGLSFFVYRVIVSVNSSDSGYVMLASDQHVKEIVLPDGSSITLNSGSRVTYNRDFEKHSRDVILEGEAFFNVVHDASLPFKVFVGESVVEVTGTSFAVREKDGAVEVSVLSGTVQLSTVDNSDKKVSITANQAGHLLTNNEIIIKESIPVNTLSWKTGHLVFDETPIDSALIDIAHHFNRDLTIVTGIEEEITAEFQDQPLNEILQELELVAGLKFDTTGTSLIVKR